MEPERQSNRWTRRAVRVRAQLHTARAEGAIGTGKVGYRIIRIFDSVDYFYRDNTTIRSARAPEDSCFRRNPRSPVSTLDTANR